MVRYICIYCNDMLDADDTIIDGDGPMCKSCYNENYEDEETKETFNAIPVKIDSPIEETGLFARLRRKKNYGDG